MEHRIARYMQSREARGQNKHHIIWQAQKDLYNVFIPINQKMVDKSQHISYNWFVRDKQSPRWLFETAYEWTSPVLSDYAQTLLKTLMEMPDEQLYKKELLKTRK
jgi:hypothetical protein